MKSTGAKPGRSETVISIILLACLLLIATGIFIKQFDYDITKFGIASENNKTEISDISLEKLDTSSLAPEGFKKYLKTEIYNSESLYEKIDGKAPLYIDAGFNRLLCQRFAMKNDEKQWLELFIYEMTDQRSAFSVYSVQRRQNALAFPSISEFAYRSTNSIYFILGRYYFEITGSSESDALFDAASFIGKKIKSDVFANHTTDIPELSLLSYENIIRESKKLYIKNAFGFIELSDTLTAEYKLANKSAIVFISIQPDAKKAELIADNYYKFLIENDGKEVKSNMDSNIKVVNLFDYIEIVFSMDRFVAGIHQAENQEFAEKSANILVQRLGNELNRAKNERTR